MGENALSVMIKEYKRNCPNCGKEIFYSSIESYCGCKKRNTKCNSCAKMGKNNPIYKKSPWIKGRKMSVEFCKKVSDGHKGMVPWIKGKHHSAESKEKMSNSHKGKKVSKETKIKLSNKIISEETKRKMSEGTKKTWNDPIIRKKRLNVIRWNNKACDKGQLELLNKWNKLGFNFKPNYLLKSNEGIFYIDGYDPIHNVVLEYDSKYHQYSKQRQKDLIRQNKIINILKPKKFWRYNSETKEIKNILEG